MINLKKILITASCTVLATAALAFGASAHPFTDIPQGAWFSDAVDYVYSEGLFAGTGEDTFDPWLPMNRAMFVRVLANKSGDVDDALYNEAVFTDVPTGLWYSAPISWASATGIVSGLGDGRYGADLAIYREQMAVVLFNYAKAIGADTSAADGSWRDFSDADRVSPYAEAAVDWAVSSGIMGGMGDGTLSPQGTAIRAQVAQIFMNASNAGVFIIPEKKPEETIAPETAETSEPDKPETEPVPAVSYEPTGEALRDLINASPLHPTLTGTAADALVEQLFSDIHTDSMDTYEKVAACYNWLARNITYGTPSVDKTVFNESVAYPLSAFDRKTAQRAWALLSTNTGVCDDFAAAFTVMMCRIGLEPYIVSGTEAYYVGERLYTYNHTWALLRLDGHDYLVDAQVENYMYNTYGNISYRFFCSDGSPSGFTYTVDPAYSADRFTRFA